ncbi:unnamed protein product [Heligmosomoides polygyrus]|uniref:Uncharacterized protein n=1 Tax=Heligmosomoides polygyrus TaxID=6339 RepID=A0A183F660_HELPZ|nr:unnamed protein product [Heligmosomoides polygyrus]
MVRSLVRPQAKRQKTEYLTTDVNEHGSININGTELSRVTSFKYLGSTVASDDNQVGDECTCECSLVQMALVDWDALRQDNTRVPQVKGV